MKHSTSKLLHFTLLSITYNHNHDIFLQAMTILSFLWCKYSQGFVNNLFLMTFNWIKAYHWCLGAFMACIPSTASLKKCKVRKFFKPLFHFLLSPTPQCHSSHCKITTTSFDATQGNSRNIGNSCNLWNSRNICKSRSKQTQRLSRAYQCPFLQWCKMSVWLESMKRYLIHLYVTAVLLNNFCSSSFLEENQSWRRKGDVRKRLWTCVKITDC